jgi:hypothetical protein
MYVCGDNRVYVEWITKGSLKITHLDSQKLSELTKENNGAGEDGERQSNVDVALAVFRGKQFVFDNLREGLRLFNLTGHGGEKEMKKKKRNKMPANPKYERVEKKRLASIPGFQIQLWLFRPSPPLVQPYYRLFVHEKSTSRYLLSSMFSFSLSRKGTFLPVMVAKAVRDMGYSQSTFETPIPPARAGKI